jgi:hypothetical protein
MNLTDSLMNLITLLVVLGGKLLQAAAYVAIAMGVLWLIGHFFPNVAFQLGLPCDQIYTCLQALVEGAQTMSVVN